MTNRLVSNGDEFAIYRTSYGYKLRHKPSSNALPIDDPGTIECFEDELRIAHRIERQNGVMAADTIGDGWRYILTGEEDV